MGELHGWHESSGFCIMLSAGLVSTLHVPV